MVSATYQSGGSSDDGLIRKLTDYEKMAGWVWLVIGIIQVLAILTALAGIWNIFAAVSRFNMAKRIAARDPAIPSEYESITQLVVIGLINLVFGAVIGIVGVGIDVFVREKILENRGLFTQDQHLTQTEKPSHNYEELEAFGALREKGFITEEEFTIQKRRILGI